MKTLGLQVMAQLELPAFSLDDWSYPAVLDRIQQCLGGLAPIARDGDAAMLEWLKWEQAPDIPEECREDLGDAVCTTAAAYGYLDTLTYARSLETPLPWSRLTTAAAALFGRLPALQWLRSPDHATGPCDWSEECTTFAAGRGDRQMLEWLRSKQHVEPCPWGPKLCSSAIKHGHLDLLQWSRAQQPPVRFDWHACNAAAELGDLKTLRWLRSQGCPWELQTLITMAVMNGHNHILEGLLIKDESLVQRDPQGLARLPAGATMKDLFALMCSDELKQTVVQTLPHQTVMYLADAGFPMDSNLYAQQALSDARDAFCAFHGLIRWFSKTGHEQLGNDEVSGAIQKPFIGCSRKSFQMLELVAQLPIDVLKKVAHAAGIGYVLQEFVPFKPAKPGSNAQASDAAAFIDPDNPDEGHGKDADAEQPANS